MKDDADRYRNNAQLDCAIQLRDIVSKAQFRHGERWPRGVTVPGDPKDCREHAKNCLRLTGRAPSAARQGTRFEDLAKTWMLLATDLEQALE